MMRLMRPIHVSWLVAISSLAIIAGVACAKYIDLSFFSTVGWMLTGATLCLVAWMKQRGVLIIFAIIGGLILGAWRGSVEVDDLANYQLLYGNTVQISGVVSEDADTDKQGNSVLRLKDIHYQNHQLPGVLWVNAGRPTPGIWRSDHVTLRGVIDEGFGTFAGSIYRPDITAITRPQPGDVALSVRNWFADQVRLGVDEPQASLGIGFLVGQRRSLPPELDTALQVAGLMHIVVASGYNLTILVRLTRRLFEHISKYLSTATATVTIAGFVAITGLSPSMNRAGLIAGLSLAAWYYGRTIHPLVLLPFAMAVTVLMNPSYVWGDVGWQLSFAAFAGVIIMAPLLQRYYFGEKKPGTIRQILGETFSAWLWTLPILAGTFGMISTVAIFANILILPLVPLAMLLTFMVGLVAALVPSIAPLVGTPAEWLLGYMTQTAQFFAGLPWAQREVSLEPWVIGVCFVLLATWCAWMWYATKLPLRQINIVE
jgi:competence protein ComEC